MTWPVPRPGLVIRYSYLWRREAKVGREEGVKDRPCAVIIARQDEHGTQRVYVLPITHSAPAQPADAIEIPMPVKIRLGLDEARSWVVLTETNLFAWPGPDLAFQPGQGPESVVYGYLPPRFFRAVSQRFLELNSARRIGVVTRND